jgi:hypothetical protein
MFLHLGKKWMHLFERGKKRLSDRPVVLPDPVIGLDNAGQLKLAPGVQISADASGLMLLDPFTGRIFVGNRVAALTVLGASEGLAIDKVAGEIATRFGIARNEAERDIRAFVEDLERNGLTGEEG